MAWQSFRRVCRLPLAWKVDGNCHTRYSRIYKLTKVLNHCRRSGTVCSTEPFCVFALEYDSMIKAKLRVFVWLFCFFSFFFFYCVYVPVYTMFLMILQANMKRSHNARAELVFITVVFIVLYPTNNLVSHHLVYRLSLLYVITSNLWKRGDRCLFLYKREFMRDLHLEDHDSRMFILLEWRR